LTWLGVQRVEELPLHAECRAAIAEHRVGWNWNYGGLLPGQSDGVEADQGRRSRSACDVEVISAVSGLTLILAPAAASAGLTPRLRPVDCDSR